MFSLVQRERWNCFHWYRESAVIVLTGTEKALSFFLTGTERALSFFSLVQSAGIVFTVQRNLFSVVRQGVCVYVCGVGGELAVFSGTAMVGGVNLSSVVLVVLAVFSGTCTRSGVGLYSVV